MNSQSIDIAQVPAKWPELLATVKAGGEVILTDHDVPQARLAPLNEVTSRQPGLHLGNFKMSPDFDEELPDEFWLGTVA